MNLLLFNPSDLKPDQTLAVRGRQHQHLRDTLQAQPGTTIRVGALNGAMGSAAVVAVNHDSTLLSVTLDKQPPPPLPLKLLVAMSRPKMIRRILQTAASLGIKEIHLINSYRVEKSFWQTPWLEAARLREQLQLGLEQSGDTMVPDVQIHKRFKPFVEDLLPAIVSGTRPLVAHPYTENPCPAAVAEPVTLAVGPEGGFIPYEVNKLLDCGFQAVTLGPRILRVETAIPVLVARLFH